MKITSGLFEDLLLCIHQQESIDVLIFFFIDSFNDVFKLSFPVFLKNI